jgi:hypothetical protein
MRITFRFAHSALLLAMLAALAAPNAYSKDRDTAAVGGGKSSEHTDPNYACGARP